MPKELSSDAKARLAVEENRVRIIPAATYEVADRDAPHAKHVVTVYDAPHDRVGQCEPHCKAAQNGRECWHVKAAYAIDHMRVKA